MKKLTTRPVSPAVLRVRAIEAKMKRAAAPVAVVVEAAPVAVVETVETTVYPWLTDEELEKIAPPVEDEPFESPSVAASYPTVWRQNSLYEWSIPYEVWGVDKARAEREELNFFLSLEKAARHRREMNYWAARLDAAPADSPSLRSWSSFYEAAEKPFNALHRARPELARYTGGPVDRFVACLGVCA